MGLTIVVYNEACGHRLDYAFVILFYAINYLSNSTEKLFIEICIKELITFHHFSLSDL